MTHMKWTDELVNFHIPNHEIEVSVSIQENKGIGCFYAFHFQHSCHILRREEEKSRLKIPFTTNSWPSKEYNDFHHHYLLLVPQLCNHLLDLY